MKVELAVTVLRAYGRPEAMAIADLLEAQAAVIAAAKAFHDLYPQRMAMMRVRKPLKEALVHLAEVEAR